MMDAETWFTADEALKHGFIDSITKTSSKPANAWNLAAYTNAPAALIEAPVVDPETVESMSTANLNRLLIAEIV